MPNTATPNQIAYIQGLQQERVWFDMDVENMTHEECVAKDAENRAAFLAGVTVYSARVTWRKGLFTKEAASYLIETLKKCDRKVSAEDKVTVPPGRYAYTGVQGQTVFVRVFRKAGRQIVVQQVSDSEQPVSPATASYALGRIAADPRAASLRYGQEIGSCGVCGRTLTDENSRAAGIGPVCSEKTGW